MIQNSLKDSNYELLKKEFQQLSNSTITVEKSLNSYCKYIKELYLSPDSICNNLKKYYETEHPLSRYSNDVLSLVQNGFSDWENYQYQNFQLISNYIDNKINNCKSQIEEIDKVLLNFETCEQLSNNQIKKNQYINLKSKLFKDVKECFVLKINEFDIPIVNIQLSFNSLFSLLNQILSDSSSLLQNHINPNNPVENLFPNNDFIDQKSSPPITSAPLSKRPPSQSFKLPPLQQSQTQTSINNSPNPLRPAPPQQQPTTTPLLKRPSSQILKQPLLIQPTPNVLPVQPNNTVITKPNAFSQFKRSAENIQASNLKLAKAVKINSIPAAPPLLQLINDHKLHKLLWDDRRYKLVKSYNHSVRAEYKVSIKYKPGVTLYRVMVWMAIPSTLQTQDIKSATMKLYDGESNKELMEPEILFSSLQNIWYFNYESPPAPFKTYYVFKEIIEVDLYKIEMVEVDDPNEIFECETITAEEIEVYLRPTDKMNFNTPEFEQLVKDNGFYPKFFDDGSQESVLCFAYRIYLWLTEHITYKFPHDLSGKPVETFKAGYGDCGCCTFFFSSVMRYNNIPTRLLFGRWAHLDKPEDGQYHVKPEIYVESIGWVPIETTNKAKDGYNIHWFARDTGEFITFGNDYHTDVKDLTNDTNLFVSFQLINFGNLYKTGPYPDRLFFNHDYKLTKINKPNLTITKPLQPPRSNPPIQQPHQSQQKSKPNNPLSGLTKTFSNMLHKSPSSSQHSNDNAPYNISNIIGIPRNPHVDQLINDHTIHKKLWDKRFKLVKTYNYSVRGIYKFKINYKPGAQLVKSKHFLSVPTSHNTQNIRFSSTSLSVNNSEEDDPTVVNEIIGSSHQDIYRMTYNNPASTKIQSITAISIIDVDLYKVHLTEVRDLNEHIEVEPITEKEIEVYLRPTTKINYDSPEFQQFIQFNRLYPINGECLLAFAYRISLYIYKTIRYQYPYSHSGEPLDAIKHGHGDCGVHSWLFASILRYNNIPVRLLYGRGALLNKPGDMQNHCKTEFYHSEIGWIPYDPAGKDGSAYHAGLFGVDCGNHITYGLDFISDIEELNNSSTPFATFQYFYFYHWGSNLTIDSSEHTFDIHQIQ